MKRKTRKIIAMFGMKADRVRVYEDRTRQLVTVEMPGRKKESWPLTDAGRAEAVAWAQGYHGRKQELAAKAEPGLTVGQLWARYADDERPKLRPATWKGYVLKWRRFESFAGHERAAMEVGPLLLVDYVKALRSTDPPIVANQIRGHVGMVKIVFAWARNGEVIPTNPVAGWRFKANPDEKKLEPAEYRTEDFEAVLAQLDPRKDGQWRAWAAWMLVGHQGVRVNSALRLRWSDVHDGFFHWPSEHDKKHRDWRQPIRDGALSALLTALDWRVNRRYSGPWVFPAGRKAREAKGEPWGVQAFWAQLRKAEDAAGVPHLPLRAFHGLRRMVVGDVLRETGDLALAMQFVGDRDLSQAPSYVKDRMDRFVEAAERLDGRRAPEPHPAMGSGMAPFAMALPLNNLQEPPVGIEPTTARTKERGNEGEIKPEALVAEGFPALSTRTEPETPPSAAPNLHPRNVQHPTGVRSPAPSQEQA